MLNAGMISLSSQTEILPCVRDTERVILYSDKALGRERQTAPDDEHISLRYMNTSKTSPCQAPGEFSGKKKISGAERTVSNSPLFAAYLGLEKKKKLRYTI